MEFVRSVKNVALKSIVSIFLLTGCAPVAIPTFESPPNDMVVEGEYTIVAKGAYCPWSPGTRSCPNIIAGSEYTVEETLPGVWEIKALNNVHSERKLVPYDPKKDLCKSDRFKDTICEQARIVGVQKLPDDPKYDQLWGMEAIKAPFAWDVETESSNVMVAIVDTGIDKNHPDLKGSIVAEYNAITGGDNADDDHGHGTHVASTACGLQNGFGVAGMSWKCNLIAAKFLNSRGSGTTSDAIKAISFLNNYAKQNNVRIIANHSWGCGGGAAMEKVLRDGIEAGVFHVGAAGNSNRNNDKFSCSPGSYSDDMVNVIAVAASDRNDNKASFSSYGKSSVQLAAPGVDILGARHGTSSHIAWRGTSMATPHVAGLASLLLHRNPQMAARELRSRIVNFTRKDSGWEDYVSSGGILDAHASLTEGLECNKRRLKRCRKQCIASYRCQFIRTRRCRKACKQRWCPSE